jgi:esterase
MNKLDRSAGINHNKLSYVDFGGNGTPLLTLHGHCGCANSFAQFAGQIKGQYRVINLDQRGHGWSDHPGIYTREAYIEDLYGIIRHLELSNQIVSGHSLGGVNTYQFAAKQPGIVKVYHTVTNFLEKL